MAKGSEIRAGPEPDPSQDRARIELGPSWTRARAKPKTTAQTEPKAEPKMKRAPELIPSAWFVCFAPYDNPEIAVACFIPNGYSGSEAAKAPRDFIGWYMEQKTLRSVDIILPAGNSLAP